MRRLALILALSPLACATPSNDAKDSPKAEPAPKTPASDEPVADDPPPEAKPTTDDPTTDDCIETGGLPPGSIPDSVAQWAEIDLAKLEAALPKDPRDPDLAHSETTAMRRGEAGHPSPLVMRGITPPDAQTSIVSITDLQDVCHCREGMGKRLHDAAVAQGDTAETIDGRLVAVKTKPTVVDLRVWIADRCELLIRAPSREEADALFEATDWAALDQACSARDARVQ